MKTIINLLIGSVLAILLSACVTTSNGVPKVKIDEHDAALKYYEVGAEYYRKGSYASARDRLEKSLSLDPQLAEAHSVIAMTYQQLGDSVRAADHFKKAIRIAPKNAGVRNTFAVFLCQQRDFDEAAKQFDSAVSSGAYRNPEVILTNAGVCLSQKPDPARAEEYFRKALTFNANYAEALLQMTLLMYSEGNSIQARAFFERLLSSNPPTAEILFLGVQIEKSLGADKTSNELAGRVLSEFPTSAEAKKILDAGYDAG